MKIAVIGGGSTYTPELVKGFLERAGVLPMEELWLMDIDPERLRVVGRFAQRMAAAKGSPFRVALTTQQREAIQGAAYVITQLRVGMMPARRNDEYLGKRHGLIGQETTGVGGMAKAMRTIPVILDIAMDMRETAPGALLLNFTNPSGLVTEALFRYTPDINSVGLCNSGIGMQMGLLKRLETRLPDFRGGEEGMAHSRLDALGLNHLTWYRGFKLDGEELWPRIMQEYLGELRQGSEPEWDLHTVESLNMIPNGYLQYFYYTGKKLADQEKWPPSRAE
jgi:6-phospho-beta-glucosidase